MKRITATTLDGGALEIPAADVESLENDLRGSLLRPADDGYDASRQVWNGMIDRRPALVARCRGVADVVACVNFARERGLLLTIKGGGHNIAGLAVADGALLLDMSANRAVIVDPVARVARVQTGCVLGDVDRETQLHGLAAVLGFVSQTGVAGLTLGGGFGYLTRRYGWTSDSVLAMEVVTADGQVRTASPDVNSDLFWGLRGGGGNLGVVTRIDFRLFPVGPMIAGGAVAWRTEDAAAVFDLLQSMSADAPPELTVFGGVRQAPPAPWIDASSHGANIVMLLVCHTGDMDEGKRIAERVHSVGTPVGSNLQPRSYVSLQSLLDATQPVGRRYYWKSEWLPELSDAFLERTLVLGSDPPSPIRRSCLRHSTVR